MVSFLKTLTREIINTILLILGVTALLFFLFNIMPGVFPGKGQGFGGYVDLLKRLFTFNFGTSFPEAFAASATLLGGIAI